MACGIDKGLVAAHYDGETTPEERLLVERHLATCSECASDLSDMRQLSASLKPLKGAAAPMSIAEGVMREVGSARRVRRPWVSWGLSAAAAVLLAVGTVYMLDRSGSPVREETFARSDAPPAKNESNREFRTEKSPKSKALVQDRAEEAGRDTPWADSQAAPKPADPRRAPAAEKHSEKPAAPPPAAEPEKREADRTGVELADKEAPERKKDESAMALGKDQKKPVTPVLRITSADETVARAEVEAFLKERKLKFRPAAEPLLGRSKVVRHRYVHVDLSYEELKALKERLTGLKGTEVTDGSFEAEKKRVAEEEAKLKTAPGARSGEDDKDAIKAEAEEKAETGAPKPQTTPDRSRGMAGDKSVERKQIILVFEPPPAKK